LFGIDEYLTGDTKNITYFLSRIAKFIKQCSLKNRISLDILQTTEFGVAVWRFLPAIYKSG